MKLLNPSNCVILASGRYGSELLPTMDCVTSPFWPDGISVHVVAKVDIQRSSKTVKMGIETPPKKKLPKYQILEVPMLVLKD